MRKWHRWLSAIFGVFLLWIAVTGVASHITTLWPDTTPQAGLPADFVCPDTMICWPKPAPDSMRAWVGFFHHLHSGEEFGPIGTGIAVLSGFAMIFFSFSGLWLYIAMWRGRKVRGIKPRWFWD
jgi:hypothetical protein